MKRSALKSHQDIVAEALKDPAYRAEWERTRLAHEVAMKVIQYRVEHNLTQTELARRLGLSSSTDRTQDRTGKAPVDRTS
jgi:DNA-binding transcriptional regulator YiaG